MPAMDPREIEQAVAELPDRPEVPTAPAQVAPPDLGALVRPPPPRRTGATLGVVALLAVAAVAAGAGGILGWRALRPKPPPRPVERPAELDESIYLPPIKTERGAGGEETAPFTGFALSIDTVPPGAVISVAGVVRGEAPLLANVASCRGTEKIEIVAAKQGFRPVRRAVACRADTLVKLTLRLEK